MSYLVPNTRLTGSFHNVVRGAYFANNLDGNKVNSAKTLWRIVAMYPSSAQELNYLKMNFSLYGKIIFTFF